MDDDMRARLDALAMQPSFQRSAVPIEADWVPPEGIQFGHAPPPGMRWETDAEFRARIQRGKP